MYVMFLLVFIVWKKNIIVCLLYENYGIMICIVIVMIIVVVLIWRVYINVIFVEYFGIIYFKSFI